MATRPIPRPISHQLEGWDVDVSQNMSLAFDTPFPVYVTDSLANLQTSFPAASFEDCFCIVGSEIVVSDGSSWKVYMKADAVADSTATTVTQMAADFNTLIAELKASGIMKSI